MYFDLFTDIVTSLVASLVWLAGFTLVRPNIFISEQIARRELSDGTKLYGIKVLNKAGRAAVNLKAELILCTPTVIPGGTLINTQVITLKRNEFF